jgi:tRNA nucleotidyltransferase/poly(A) polymerase
MMLPIDTDMFPQKKGVYVVGGSIRDILCGRTPFDYDLAVQSDPAVFARHLASRTSGRIVELGKHGQLMRRVVTGNHFFDILPVNGKSIQDDLRQRDFTINAMAMEVFSGNLIDQLGGRHDIAAKKVRMVTRDVFRKDPVRLIRAYRMAASFDFTIDEDTQTAIARDANLIRQSAGERIREELLKIIQCAKSHVYLSQMADSGLLFSIFYELRKLKNDHLPIDAPSSLFEQTLASYYHLEELLDPGNLIMRTIGDKFFQDGDKSQPGLLKLTVLFHDIGKPSAQAPTGGPISGHFCHHTVESAAMAKEICRRLRFSRRQTDYIEFIIRNHLRPLYLFKARQKKVPIQKVFIRFCMKCGDFTPDILLHALAGLSAKRVSDNQSIQDFTEFVQKLTQEYYRVLRPRASLPLPLNGMDLINEFGLKPSALFRRILKHVEEERLARQVLTREQAIKLVAELLKQ